MYKAIAAEGLIVTAGGIGTSTYIIFLLTFLNLVWMNGITTLFGGGTGPADW